MLMGPSDVAFSRLTRHGGETVVVVMWIPCCSFWVSVAQLLQGQTVWQHGCQLHKNQWHSAQKGYQPWTLFF